MAYASSTLSLNDKPAAEHTAWSNDFRRLVTDAHSTSNQITSVLSLLSSCLTNGQALPPYLEMPQPYAFVRRLESIDKNILSVRHIGEPEYSAFAVLQICGGSVTADLEKLVKYVSAPFLLLKITNANAMADMYGPWSARSTSHSTHSTPMAARPVAQALMLPR
jgi:hypothetical protein